jgi:diguanylate cyclase (GGDEF)-like protein
MMGEIRVLHFEDAAADRLLAAASLETCTFAQFSVQHAVRLKDGLAQLAAEPYDAILLDLGLPDSQGAETYECVHEAAPDTAILVLTGREDDELGAALVKAGAQDYLPKSELVGGMLARSVRYAIERKEMQSTLRRLALHDPLTGLPNRTLLTERAQQLLAMCDRGSRMALAYIDMDGFKAVNDTFGHACGDELLRAIAARLSSLLRSSDTLTRLGGDEFVVLAAQIHGRADAIKIARKLLAALEQPFVVAEHTVTLSASIGVGLYPEHGHDFDSLLIAADEAMYRSKRDGRNNYAFATTSETQSPRAACRVHAA